MGEKLRFPVKEASVDDVDQYHLASLANDPLWRQILRPRSSLQMRPQSRPIKTATLRVTLSQNHPAQPLPNS